MTKTVCGCTQNDVSKAGPLISNRMVVKAKAAKEAQARATLTAMVQQQQTQLSEMAQKMSKLKGPEEVRVGVVLLAIDGLKLP